jgi:hypothetical protein
VLAGETARDTTSVRRSPNRHEPLVSRATRSLQRTPVRCNDHDARRCGRRYRPRSAPRRRSCRAVALRRAVGATGTRRALAGNRISQAISWVAGLGSASWGPRPRIVVAHGVGFEAILGRGRTDGDTRDADVRRRPRSLAMGALLALIFGSAVVAAGVSAAGSAGSPGATIAARGSNCHRDVPPLIRDGFAEPPLRYSRNGLLDTVLRASVSAVSINHRRVVTMNYDGSFPGPALVICNGDRLIIHFVNHLREPTNLHTHGLHVSPSGNHDNVFVRINPGRRFTYEYQIPRDNEPGSYWYHPHLHMFVERQSLPGWLAPWSSRAASIRRHYVTSRRDGSSFRAPRCAKAERFRWTTVLTRRRRFTSTA